MKILTQAEYLAPCHALIHYLPTRGERDFLREDIAQVLKDRPKDVASSYGATREKPAIIAQKGMAHLFRIETPAPYFDFATSSGGDDFCGAFRACLNAANDKSLESVVIGSLSVGIGAYPLDLAIALLNQVEREWKRANRRRHLKSIGLSVANAELRQNARHFQKIYGSANCLSLPRISSVEALWKVERVIL